MPIMNHAETYDQELTGCPDCGEFVRISEDIESNGQGVAFGRIECPECGFAARETWVHDLTERVVDGTGIIDLGTVQGWLDATYNDALTAYEFDEFVRLTNGSGGHMIDIRRDGDEFQLSGRRYGEDIDKSCPATKDALLETLRHTI